MNKNTSTDPDKAVPAWLVSHTPSGRLHCSPLPNAAAKFINAFAAAGIEGDLIWGDHIVSFDVARALSEAIAGLAEADLHKTPGYPLILPPDEPVQSFMVIAPPDCETSHMVRFLKLLAAASKNGFMVTAGTVDAS